jgi:hypothetical protein
VTWDIFFQLVQQFGLPITILLIGVLALVMEWVVPGRVRDRDVTDATEQCGKEADFWKEQFHAERAERARWEGTALRLTTLAMRGSEGLKESAELMREVREALLGRRDVV